MPVNLSNYPGAASDRGNKFKRAIQSFVDQTTPEHIELVIVSDGCDGSRNIFNQLKESFFADNRSIVFHQIKKCQAFSGRPRNEGIDIATSNIIAYLDSDDYLTPTHANNIVFQFQDVDWCYWNDCVVKAPNNIHDVRMRGVNIAAGAIGTSNVAHKKNLTTKWPDGYGHDWLFIEELARSYSNHRFIQNNCGYVVCHIPNFIDA